MRFKQITLHCNVDKTDSRKLAEKITLYLQQKGITVDFCIDCAVADFPPGTDLIIAIGGDGTILQTLRMAAPLGIPVLGLNAGTLGFLSSVEGKHFEEHLDKILAGEFVKAERTLLNVSILHHDKYIAKNLLAINECVLKASGIRAFTVEIDYKHHKLNEYFGDGIIVATPTGSTAYSLAAGGPIVAPGTGTFVLTPICPHTISQRPMVLPVGRIVLTPRFKRPDDTAMLSMDGQNSFIMHGGSAVEITPSPHKAVFMFDKEYDYFKNLYKKFKWGSR